MIKYKFVDLGCGLYGILGVNNNDTQASFVIGNAEQIRDHAVRTNLTTPTEDDGLYEAMCEADKVVTAIYEEAEHNGGYLDLREVGIAGAEVEAIKCFCNTHYDIKIVDPNGDMETYSYEIEAAYPITDIAAMAAYCGCMRLNRVETYIAMMSLWLRHLDPIMETAAALSMRNDRLRLIKFSKPAPEPEPRGCLKYDPNKDPVRNSSLYVDTDSSYPVGDVKAALNSQYGFNLSRLVPKLRVELQLHLADNVDVHVRILEHNVEEVEFKKYAYIEDDDGNAYMAYTMVIPEHSLADVDPEDVFMWLREYEDIKLVDIVNIKMEVYL